MLFLDSDQPIKTCISENCDGCAVHKSLHCHFTLTDLIHFLFISIPTFLLGGAGVYHESGWLLLLWMCMIIGFFAFLEIRVTIIEDRQIMLITRMGSTYVQITLMKSYPTPLTG